MTPPRRSLTLLLILADAFLVAAAFGAAHLLRDAALTQEHVARVAPAALGTALLAVPVFGLCGLYDLNLTTRGWRQVGALVRAWALVMGVTILAIFLLKAGSPLRSRLALALFCTLGFGGTVALRLGAWRPWLRRRYGRSLRGAQVIVGTGRLARRVAGSIRPDDRGEPVLVGFVDAVAPAGIGSGDHGFPAPFLGGTEVVHRLARERRISQVLVAREDLTRGRLVGLAHEWLDEGLRVSLVSSAFEVMVARASAGLLEGIPLVELKRTPQRGWGLRAKRVFDVLAVLVGGGLLLPVLVSVALAVKLTSRGPILYRQERVGRRGKRFTLFKFRSMIVNNDDGTHRRYVEGLMRGEAATVDGNGDRVYKLVDDPRITPIGGLLRRTSLDELPQLWNVLRGEMSLVGPRPCLPYEWDLYEDWQRHRLDALPGITGLWQVSARSRVTFEEMVLLDLHYITNWSLGLDFLLLAKTCPVVVLGAGGH